MKNTKRGFIPFSKTALFVALSAGMLAAAPLARADAISDLKAQIDALQKKVEALSAAQQAAPAAAAPANAVTGGDIPGSFKLPGSNTSVKFGGYVKGDVIVSNRSAGGGSPDQDFEGFSIPLDRANGKNELTMHARQTRFNMTTSTPSAMGNVKTFFEADFFGTDGNERVSNSNGLRLRHAYGSIGGLLVGQTWSNFMDVGAASETLDFGGPAGALFNRQTQIRYTQPFSGGQWSASLENPASVIAGTPPENRLRNDDRVPDITGRVDFKTSYGLMSVTGLARQIRIDAPAVAFKAATPTSFEVKASPAYNDSKWGAAIGFSGVIPTFGKDTFNFNSNYGNVLGRYVSVILFPDAALVNGKLDLSNTWNASIGYTHFWNTDLRSTAILSGTRTSFGQGVDLKQTESVQSAHLNLIWSPVKNTNVGIEYIYGHRKTVDDQTGVLNRIQASAQYNF